MANRLDAVYKQKFRKRQAKRQQPREAAAGGASAARFAYPPQPYAPQPPIFSNNPNLYSQYPATAPKVALGLCLDQESRIHAFALIVTS